MIFGLFGGNQPAQTPQELGYKRFCRYGLPVELCDG